MGGIVMWIARDKNSDLVLHETKSTKKLNYWFSKGMKEALAFGNFWFPEVKWEDEEPTELILKR